MKCLRWWHGRMFRFKYYLLFALFVAYLAVCRLILSYTVPIHLFSNPRTASKHSLSMLKSTNHSYFVAGNFLKGVSPRNESHCRFNYGLPESLRLPEAPSPSPELGAAGPYRVIYNVIEAQGGAVPDNGTAEQPPNVTYCTHATPEYLYNVAEVARRWGGPVSVAVYAPGSDAALAMRLLRRLCLCLPEMARVSAHLVFPDSHPPDLDPAEATEPPTDDCAPPEDLQRTQTFRRRAGLAYAVNAGRNAARAAAVTTYVLVSDVELLPSSGLVLSFLAMLARLRRRAAGGGAAAPQLPRRNHVFVVPVFEVEANVAGVPATKAELLRLYGHNLAFYFHRWTCSHCQKFPGLTHWLQRKPVVGEDGGPVVQPLLTVRREFPFHRWEPLFVGTAADPLYSEELSWEGHQDKMTQAAEMCLRGYQFVILDGAFLVHTPGVKRPHWPGTGAAAGAAAAAQRRAHDLHNAAMYSRITARLADRYPARASRCKV